MSWSIRLFRIKGIQIKVHLTFVLILVWAAYRWSTSTGQGLHGALFGIAATLLLFAAVTLHELGHSFQARRYGVRVNDIILTPVGGLARLDNMPEKPLQELRVALAGPLVNFAIAGLLILLGLIFQARSLLTLTELAASVGQVSWSGMLAYLTMANLVIGIFNLIPAYPMDGGRILRALLALRLDAARATQIAAGIGQGLALALGLWGLLAGSYSIILIALFVWMGAGQESRSASLESGLTGIRVHDAMTRSPQSLKMNDPLSKAVDLTLTSSQSDFPVVEWGSNKVTGFISGDNLLAGLKQKGSQAPVREIMHAPVVAVRPDQPLTAAIEQMNKSRLRAVPVTDDDQNLVGLLTSADINEAYRLLARSPQRTPARS